MANRLHQQDGQEEDPLSKMNGKVVGFDVVGPLFMWNHLDDYMSGDCSKPLRQFKKILI
jgi:hypothetical protein